MRAILGVLLALVLCVGVAWGQAAPGTITIGWTAPGDDGLVGRATYYDVQIKRASSATYLATLSSLVPGASGSAELFRFVNLVPDTLYDMRIRACDEVPNCGGFSNVVRLAASPAAPRDSLPPGTITIVPVTGALLQDGSPLRRQVEWVTKRGSALATNAP